MVTKTSPDEELGKTRCVSAFEKLGEIGEGTFGTVYKARDRDSGAIVALKKIKMSIETEGFPVTSLREIKILQELDHENIIRLLEVVVGYRLENIFLVFEYCEIDLAKYVDKMSEYDKYFSLAEVKCILLKILKGVAYLHQNNVLHRDLKFSNILINSRGELKLADFGLARKIGFPLVPYTPKVVTLWYRPPEILLGAEYYSKPCDAWAVGCIFAELLNYGHPIFPGKSEVNQFQCICELLGIPTEKIWPNFFTLPGSKKLLGIVSNKYNRLPEKFSVFSSHCINLLSGLLAWDPAKRTTINEAILHDFFNEDPLPSDCIKLQEF